MLAAKIAYGQRNKLLRCMGFTSYQEYLDSDLWKEIRTRMLKRWPNCYACGRPASQVHHVSYRREALEGKADHELWTLCRRCHSGAERLANGLKLPPQAAAGRLRQWRRKQKGCTLNTRPG